MEKQMINLEETTELRIFSPLKDASLFLSFYQ